MASYDLGDIATFGVTITDAAGDLADATTVTATVTDPLGVAHTCTVTHASTGVYNSAFTPTVAGRHLVRWLATGTNASAYTDEFTVRDLTHLPVIGYFDALAHLNIPQDSVSEDEMRRFIDAAQDLAENYVGCVLGRQTFTAEKYDGNQDHIRLRSPRAINIVEVIENGVTLAANDYQLDPTGQRLYRLTTTALGYGSYGVWGPGVNAIQVTYNAGFQVTPPAAQQGVLEILRHLWETQRGAVSVIRRSGGDSDFYPTATYSLPRRAMELLDPLSLPGLA